LEFFGEEREDALGNYLGILITEEESYWNNFSEDV
jgi:hypothetical protein